MRSAVALKNGKAIHYPDSDGKPLAETDWHLSCILFLRAALDALTRTWPNCRVFSDMYLYYEEGNPKARKSPDTMVVKGITKELRPSFMTWVEKAVPCTIFEITSRKTRDEDLKVKPAVYAGIGVKELFLFDPRDEYLEPNFQGFRLRKGEYVPMKLAADGSLTSQELQVRLIPEGYMLRLIDLRTGQPILTEQELLEHAEQEKQRADALAAEVAKLRAQLNN